MALSRTRKTIFWQEGNIVGGPTPFFTDTGTSQQFGGYSYQEFPTINDSIEFSVALDPGDYMMEMLGVKAGASAIQEIFLDGVSQVVIDRYSGSFDFNQVDMVPLTLVNPVSVIRSDVIGQNVSSSAMYISITRLYFRKV